MKRNFSIGSEWLYYKIYCGYKTADDLLTDVIGPLSEMFVKNNVIDKWFFIRYADPNPHIRWRLHFKETDNISIVLTTIIEKLQPYMDSYEINKIAVDTYKREIERYGESTIELCEDLFYHDSDMIAKVLANINEGNDKELYRCLFSLKAIDSLLKDFGFTIDKRHEFMKSIADAFGKEFAINEFTIQQFSYKYRNIKHDISQFMNCKNDQAEGIYELIELKSLKTKDVITQINKLCIDDKLFDRILSSVIHMTMNRIFIAQQRKYEVLLYGFLERYYRSEVAKLKYQNKVE